MVAIVPSAKAPAGLPTWGGRYALRKTGETLARWGRQCHLCRQPGATTADHLIPRSKGGSDEVETNLRPAHHGCNSARGDRDLAEWFAAHPVRQQQPLAPSREW